MRPGLTHQQRQASAGRCKNSHLLAYSDVPVCPAYCRQAPKNPLPRKLAAGVCSDCVAHNAVLQTGPPCTSRSHIVKDCSYDRAALVTRGRIVIGYHAGALSKPSHAHFMLCNSVHSSARRRLITKSAERRHQLHADVRTRGSFDLSVAYWSRKTLLR